ncbi:MAG TPA: oxidoreductase [Solirubrobacteraceae bacterium]|jgi:NAD(P)-dependent dehydrogenase (short-subunit alcohol dehydrogenase family)|nr:oxidoreductase [Solirubrobacteraceae bacterium]
MGKWTADDIPDQSGRRAIVTGANGGLGYQVSLELARHGARVILAARDPERGQAALDRLLAEVPGADAELRRLDLASLDAIRAFADGVDEPVDLLVNNAGVMAGPYRRTADGFEMQLGTNHLGHFALTGLLLPRLLESERPRVVTVSSGAHRIGRMQFDDLNFERGYNRWRAYGQSKLANLLFMRELARRAAEAGTPLVSVSAHPGYASTHLQSTGTKVDDLLMKVTNRLIAQSDAMGALPLLYAATEDLESGAYVGPDGMGEQRGHPKLVGMTQRARDPEAARRLWAESERLTGVTYDLTRTPQRT